MASETLQTGNEKDPASGDVGGEGTKARVAKDTLKNVSFDEACASSMTPASTGR